MALSLFSLAGLLLGSEKFFLSPAGVCTVSCFRRRMRGVLLALSGSARLRPPTSGLPTPFKMMFLLFSRGKKKKKMLLGLL